MLLRRFNQGNGLFNIHDSERNVCLISFAIFFCLLSSYYILRPIRESMAIAGGLENIPWLFSATFLGGLVIVPVYGWACAHLHRAWLLAAVYASVVVALIVFYFLFNLNPDDPSLARAFYVWISVFNLLIVSVFWSLMADLFNPEQAHRVFGFIAAGGSLGALCGPLVSALLVAHTGHALLFLVSAAGFGCAVCLVFWLISTNAQNSTNKTADHPMSGDPFTGLFLVMRTPFLQGYGLFILLLSGVSTFLYFQQAELVRDAFPDNESRTQLFAWVDFAVNTLSIGSQLFLTGNIVKRFGVSIHLVSIPVLLLLGFVSFALYPMLSAAIGVMMVRRVGEYAFIRPCREMLFTNLSRDMKYKAKHVIDIVVYRGADALNSWFFIACQQFGLALTGTAWIGATLAGLSALTGYALGRRHDQS